MRPCQDKRDSTGVEIHGGVGSAVSADGDVIGETEGETGGHDGGGSMGQVICICPYVPPHANVPLMLRQTKKEVTGEKNRP